MDIKEIKILKDIVSTLDENESIELIVTKMSSVKGMTDAIMYKLMDEDKNCTHPKEHRLNLTVMGSKEEWECKLCGYHSKDGEEVES